jgi:hypothetical protein
MGLITCSYWVYSIMAGLGYDNAKSLCGFLGLRSPFSTWGYHQLELQVGQIMIPMVDNILIANLLEEIASSLVRRDDGSIDLAASFDMAWQKRSSENAYDSTSGHAFMVGALNKKIIGMIVMAKVCAFCVAWDKNMSIVKIVKLHTTHQITISREIIQAVLNQWNLRLECFY